MLLLSAKCPGPPGRWKKHFERRFGEPFEGPVIPFGAKAEYCPISAPDQSRPHQFGKKVLAGVFFGYALFVEDLEMRHAG